MHTKTFACCLLSLIFVTSCRIQRHEPVRTADPEFKMILRLWPDHHNDTSLLNDFLQALEKYPDACDEVWLCMEFETLSEEAHRNSARAMASAAERIRALGVEVSIQGISIGHGDDFESGMDNSALKPTWGTMIDAWGNRVQTGHCPRQKAFHDYLDRVYSTYAEACHPACVWIDDDLRITNHSPARQICFCDTCLTAFNARYGGNWTREKLAHALNRNEKNGELRKEWIAFSQESLAEAARTIAHGVHRVSPTTKMGLQHANFHRELQEGRDWNPIFDALEEETSLAPASRPGSGFYNDHAPRGMIQKGYDMARQIRRLKPSVREIAPEIEGYRHCATGKSARGLCVESQLYLALGGTQLSYAILCAASEPMEWYADNYLKALARWRPHLEEYAAFNRGTEPGGIDPYISPDHVLRDMEEGEPPFAWAVTGAGDEMFALAPLGLPFTPDGHYSSALMMDALAIEGLAEEEAVQLFRNRGILLDRAAWEWVRRRRLDTLLRETAVPEGLSDVKCLISDAGGRTAVIPAYRGDINNARRLELLRIADWVSDGKLPAIMETMAQAVVVPRVDSTGGLRSVMLLNCSISPQDSIRLRLRGCPAESRPVFVWKKAERKDIVLTPRYDGTDAIVVVPALDGWDTGWLAVE